MTESPPRWTLERCGSSVSLTGARGVRSGGTHAQGAASAVRGGGDGTGRGSGSGRGRGGRGGPAAAAARAPTRRYVSTGAIASLTATTLLLDGRECLYTEGTEIRNRRHLKHTI